MKRSMDNETIRNFNKLWKGFMTVSAIALAIGAIIYNPGHLFSALILWVMGQELGLKENPNE